MPDSKVAEVNKMEEICSKPILLETHYLPCVEYFVLLSKQDFVIHKDETYQKQSYRNRCYIVGPNKTQLLTVPVTGKTKRAQISDVRIDYSENWHIGHLRSIRTAYGKAPYFEYYFEYFEQVLIRKYEFLWDLNHQMLTLCLNLLKIDRKISDSKQSHLNLSELDNRYYGLISRKTSFLDRNIYKEAKYQQLFGSNFVPNLSIIDLLFCEGPNSGTIISQSTISNN